MKIIDYKNTKNRTKSTKKSIKKTTNFMINKYMEGQRPLPPKSRLAHRFYRQADFEVTPNGLKVPVGQALHDDLEVPPVLSK